MRVLSHREYYLLHSLNEANAQNTFKQYGEIIKKKNSARDIYYLFVAMWKRINRLPKSIKRLFLRVTIVALMGTPYFSDFKGLVNEFDTVLHSDILTQEEIWYKTFGWELKNPLEMTISENGMDSIKDHEKLVLTAYKLGDGKITIGYGHAEPIKKTKFRVGQKISKELADRLFEEDIKYTQEGVHRIFSDWEEQGIEIKLTQSQFDVIISLAYNMGVSGLRNSEFIQLIKQNKLDEAGNLIPDTGIREKFRKGLSNRRNREASFFYKSD